MVWYHSIMARPDVINRLEGLIRRLHVGLWTTRRPCATACCLQPRLIATTGEKAASDFESSRIQPALLVGGHLCSIIPSQYLNMEGSAEQSAAGQEILTKISLSLFDLDFLQHTGNLHAKRSIG
jgi:hypothetical protein